MRVAGEMSSDLQNEILKVDVHFVASELCGIVGDVGRAADANNLCTYF